MERDGRESTKKEAREPSSPPSEPMAVSRPPGGRRAYVSGNHLLSFEVTSSPGSGFGAYHLSSPARRSRGTRPGTSFTKERFIHANFRFIVREEVVSSASWQEYNVNPDTQIEWNDIEMVIVPAQQDVTCPICLDKPLTPQLTKCGHFFCWPCILRYAAATSSAGSGNWRKCPICFESVSVRQLKSVYFNQVTDFTTSSLEITEIGIPMVLMTGNTNSCKIHLAERKPNQPVSPRSLSDLCPFEKITFVSRDFVENHIVGRAMEDLLERLHGLDEDDPDKVYTELALTMVEDRRTALVTEEPSPKLSDAGKSKTFSTEGSPLFFHQSLDGQPFFLSPFSIKILRRQFGTYSEMPHFLCAPVLEIEMSIMTEELRRRHRYLHHLPVGCQFGLCEVDLSLIVSASVLEEFSTEINSKAKSRKSKAVKEAKMSAAAQKREQRMFESTSHGSWDDGRASPSVPGVATGIFGTFTMDYENFPLPGTVEEPSSTAIPIASSEPVNKSITSGLASSFASIAATSPDGFVVVASNSSPPQVDFSICNEDIGRISSPSSDSTGKKGKRVVLVSNIQRRQS